MLQRLLGAIATPSKWGKVWSRTQLLTQNVTRYGTFSTNPNTRENWNSRLQAFDDFWRDENYHHLLDLFPADERFSLLDIGCALGDGCELLQRSFPQAQIWGADISETGIAKAKARHSTVSYFVLDVLTDPIPDTYDYILLVETLEHFDHPFRVVDKCLAHVRRSLIISVPYAQNLGNVRLEVSHHRHRFDEQTFSGYRGRVVRITDYVQVTQDRCIIYELNP